MKNLCFAFAMVALAACASTDGDPAPLRQWLVDGTGPPVDLDDALRWSTAAPIVAADVDSLDVEPFELVRAIEGVRLRAGDDAWLAGRVVVDGGLARASRCSVPPSASTTPTLRPSSDPEARRLVEGRADALAEFVAACGVPADTELEVHVVDGAPMGLVVLVDDGIVLVNRRLLSAPTAPTSRRTAEASLVVTADTYEACRATVEATCPPQCLGQSFPPTCEPLFEAGGAGDCYQVSILPGDGIDAYCAWVLSASTPSVAACLATERTLGGERYACVDPAAPVADFLTFRSTWGAPIEDSPCWNTIRACAGAPNSIAAIELATDDAATPIGDFEQCAVDVDTRCRLCLAFPGETGCGDCFDLMRAEARDRAPYAACVAGTVLPVFYDCMNATDRCIDPDQVESIASYEQLVLAMPGFFDDSTYAACQAQVTTCIEREAEPSFDYEAAPPNYDPFASPDAAPSDDRCPR